MSTSSFDTTYLFVRSLSGFDNFSHPLIIKKKKSFYSPEIGFAFGTYSIEKLAIHCLRAKMYTKHITKYKQPELLYKLQFQSTMLGKGLLVVFVTYKL